MKVSTERLPQSQVALEIEVDDERLEKAVESTYRSLASKVKIPGFRPGKAPRAIVERHLGEDTIRQEAIDRLMPQVYKEALEQEAIEPVDRAVWELVQERPLVAKFTVPVRPSVELGDYASLRVPREEVTIEPERAQEGLEALRQRYATLEPVSRPIEWQDVVRADVEASADGRVFLKEEDVEFQLVEGRPVSLPGVAEAFIGHAKGDEFEAEIRVPEDVKEERLRGRQARYRIRVKEAKQIVLPELDDDFARQVGEGFESLAALRARVESDIREQLERETEHRYHDQLVDALAEQAHLEYPPVLVEREIDRLVEDQLGGGRSGRPAEQLERYLQQAGKSEDELRDELRTIAERRIRRSLVLSEVAKAEHIDVTDEEVEAEVDRIASGAGAQSEEFRRLFSGEAARESLRRSLLTKKTLDRLVELATAGVALEAR
jgi:trigger factor